MQGCMCKKGGSALLAALALCAVLPPAHLAFPHCPPKSTIVPFLPLLMGCYPAVQAWFHLYRILLTADDLSPAEVAPTVETFVQVGRTRWEGGAVVQGFDGGRGPAVCHHRGGRAGNHAALPDSCTSCHTRSIPLQSSPLGEFASRLSLLEAFACQLTAMSAAAPAPPAAAGSPAGVPTGAEPSQEQQRQRWRQLSALLHNVCRYYRQFEPAVAGQIAAGMAELEKALQVGGASCSVHGQHLLCVGLQQWNGCRWGQCSAGLAWLHACTRSADASAAHLGCAACPCPRTVSLLHVSWQPI